MLDRLPVELSRHILSLAHPPPARTPSFPDALLARQRSLIACQRLLWERVWYRPEASSQVDHLVTTEGDEGGLVRTFEYERFELGGDTPEYVDPMDVIRKMPDLVELTVRENVDVELDLCVLVGLKNLVRLSPEGTKVELGGFDDLTVTAADLVMRQLEHLVLEGVCKPAKFDDTFFEVFFAVCTPALKTLAFSRLEAGGKRVVPGVFRAPSLQLDALHLSLAEYARTAQPICWSGTPIVASLDEYGARAIFDTTLPDHEAQVARVCILARRLVLSFVEVELDFPGDRVVAPALVLARALVVAGHVETLFLPSRLRVNGPVYQLPMLDVVQRREAAADKMYAALRGACVEHGVETFFLDEEADITQWLAWAQADPALRRLVALNEESDAGVDARNDAAGSLFEMIFGSEAGRS